MANYAHKCLPDWLSEKDVEPHPPVEARQSLTVFEFNTLFPIILERVSGGLTVQQAIRSDRRDIDLGSFMAWVRKSAARVREYDAAKEARSEIWAGNIIEHATGESGLEDIQRSKLIIDTYFRLMESDNRKVYGKSHHIEVNSTVSISAALNAARARVGFTIEHEPPPALSVITDDVGD